MKTNSTKQHLKVVAKELGVPKSTPKKMIKDKVISFELINGHYHIDADEVREALKEKSTSRARSTNLAEMDWSGTNEEVLNNYIDTTLETLITVIDRDWKSNVKDTDLAVVYKRTLKRNLPILQKMQNKEQLDLLNNAMKISDKEVYRRQILICNKLRIQVST